MKEKSNDNTNAETLKAKRFEDAELRVVHFDANNVVVTTSQCVCNN